MKCCVVFLCVFNRLVTWFLFISPEEPKCVSPSKESHEGPSEITNTINISPEKAHKSSLQTLFTASPVNYNSSMKVGSSVILPVASRWIGGVGVTNIIFFMIKIISQFFYSSPLSFIFHTLFFILIYQINSAFLWFWLQASIHATLFLSPQWL